MQYTLPTLAQIVNGELENDSGAQITHLQRIEDGSAGGLCFLANPKYYAELYSTQCSAVLVPQDFEPNGDYSPVLIRVKDPAQAFNQLVFMQGAQQAPSFTGRQDPHFIHPTATVADDVDIAAFVYIGEGAEVQSGARLFPHVYIGKNARVGEDCILHANSVLADDCVMGDSCILQPGAVIGSDGFGYIEQDGENIKIPQLGSVRLKDDVEVGANTCIDRAVLGETVIESGVKLDNLVHIAHNVRVGKNTFMAAQVGIAGSTSIGAYCMFGGQSGVGGHIHIAEGSKFGAKSGLVKDIRVPNQAWRGRPVQPYRDQLRSEAVHRQLPDLLKRIQALESELDALRSKR